MLSYDLFADIVRKVKLSGSDTQTQCVLLSEGCGLEVVVAAICCESYHLAWYGPKGVSQLSGGAPPICLVIAPTTVGIQLLQHGIRFHMRRWERYARADDRLALAAEGIPVSCIEEGASPSERIERYGRGGVVVVSAKHLCADLLHRRVSAHCAVGAIFTIPAFGGYPDAEILGFAHELLSTTSSAAATAGARPHVSTTATTADPLLASGTTTSTSCHIHVVSDTAFRMGQRQNLLKVLNVAELIIVPRSRNDIREHFERLQAEGKSLPLRAERIPMDKPRQQLMEVLLRIVAQIVDEIRSIGKGEDGDSGDGGPPVDMQAPTGHLKSSRAITFQGSSKKRSDRHGKAGPQAAASSTRPSVIGRGLTAVVAAAKRPREQRQGGGDDGDAAEEASWLMSTAEDVVKSLTVEDVLLHRRGEAIAAIEQCSVDVLKSLKNLVKSARQVSRLFHLAAKTPAARFLAILEAEIQPPFPGQKRGGVGGAFAGANLPYWTLSNHFPELVDCATRRVYTIVPPQKVAASQQLTLSRLSACSSDLSLVSSDLIARYATSCIHPSVSGMRPRRLNASTKLVLGWVKTALSQKEKEKTPSSSSDDNQPPPSDIVVIVPSTFALQQLQHRLLVSDSQFIASDFNRFLCYYQRQQQQAAGPQREHGDAVNEPVDAAATGTASTGTSKTRRRSKVTFNVGGGEDNLEGDGGEGDETAAGDDEAGSVPLRHTRGDEFLDLLNADDDTDQTLSMMSTQRAADRQLLVPSTVHSDLMSLPLLPEDDELGASLSLSMAPYNQEEEGGGGGNDVADDDDEVQIVGTSSAPTAPSDDVVAVGESTEESRFRSTVEGLLVSTGDRSASIQFSYMKKKEERNGHPPPPALSAFLDGCDDAVEVIDVDDDEAWDDSEQQTTTTASDCAVVMVTLLRSDEVSSSKLLQLLRRPPAAGTSSAAPPPSPPLTQQRVLLFDYDLHVLRTVELLSSLLSEEKANIAFHLFQDATTTELVAEATKYRDDNRQKDLARCLTDVRLADERASILAVAKKKSMLTAELRVDTLSRLKASHELEVIPATRRREAAARTQQAGAPQIIFDERELRASLPILLHRRGIQVVPLTLITGDYVLSPFHVVERKAIPDLFASVLSAKNRLQKQLQAMERRYDRSMLLIEFEKSAPFRFVNHGTGSGLPSSTSRSSEVRRALVRMLSGTRKTTVLWSRSPAHSAGMLGALKESSARDNADTADPALTVREADNKVEARRQAIEVLLRFPGVTRANVTGLMDCCTKLSNLPDVPRESLQLALGDENAEKLWSFLHDPIELGASVDAC